MNASPGLIHMVQEALNSPMNHMPMTAADGSGMQNASIHEVACWIMGFEHAMRMVESYINAAQPAKPLREAGYDIHGDRLA